MKNMMCEGCDRELMVNIFTTPLPFTYSSSMQNRMVTSCKKQEDMRRNGETGRKVVMYTEDYACNLCWAKKKKKTRHAFLCSELKEWAQECVCVCVGLKTYKEVESFLDHGLSEKCIHIMFRLEPIITETLRCEGFHLPRGPLRKHKWHMTMAHNHCPAHCSPVPVIRPLLRINLLRTYQQRATLAA